MCNNDKSPDKKPVMSVKDYYLLAEERIGQYDGHALRYRQWLVPVVSAFVIAAYYQRNLGTEKTDVVDLLAWSGCAAIGLLFLAEMIVHAQASRLINSN